MQKISITAKFSLVWEGKFFADGPLVRVPADASKEPNPRAAKFSKAVVRSTLANWSTVGFNSHLSVSSGVGEDRFSSCVCLCDICVFKPGKGVIFKPKINLGSLLSKRGGGEFCWLMNTRSRSESEVCWKHESANWVKIWFGCVECHFFRQSLIILLYQFIEMTVA